MVLPPGINRYISHEILEKVKTFSIQSMTRELVTKVDSQVEITKAEKGYSYKIVWGNPLTGDKDGGIFASHLKINGYAVATSGMQIGEYGKEVEIRQNTEGGGCNIVLPD